MHRRIFDGTFGICQKTQKPIKKARLKVVRFHKIFFRGQTMYENRKITKLITVVASLPQF